METLQKKQNKKLIPIIIGAVILVVGIVATIVIVNSNNSKGRVSKLLEAGNRYLSELDYEQAIAAFTNVIKIDPSNVDAYLSLADAYCGQADQYLGNGNIDSAIDAYENALDVLNDCIEINGSDARVEEKIRIITDIVYSYTSTVTESGENVYDVDDPAGSIDEGENNDDDNLTPLQRIAAAGDTGNIINWADANLFGRHVGDCSFDEWIEAAKENDFTRYENLIDSGDGNLAYFAEANDGRIFNVNSGAYGGGSLSIEAHGRGQDQVDFCFAGLNSNDTYASSLNKLGFSNGDEIADYVFGTVFDSREEAEALYVPINSSNVRDYGMIGYNGDGTCYVSFGGASDAEGGGYVLQSYGWITLGFHYEKGTIMLSFNKQEGEENYKLNRVYFDWFQY